MILSAFTSCPSNGLSLVLENICTVSSTYDTHKPENVPTAKAVLALWDTGATCTMIAEQIAQELGLIPTGGEEVYNAGGIVDVNFYDVNITLPNGRKFLGWFVYGTTLHRVELLIGIIITYGAPSLTKMIALNSLSKCPPRMI
jgi:hypothetical protein